MWGLRSTHRCLTTALLCAPPTSSLASLSTTASMNNNNSPASSSPSPFRVIRREPGQTSSDLPIFAATPEAAWKLLDDDDDDKDDRECQRSPPTAVQKYQDGVFVIHNLLSSEECQRIQDLSEKMGYTEDAPVSLGRDIRKNENCVWIMDERVNRILFERARTMLPAVKFQGLDLGEPVGLNQRWRLYKYNPSDVFKAHTDGAWPGSGVDEGGNYVHNLYDGSAVSWLTFLIYLNDDFQGGSTKFPMESKNIADPAFFQVRPTQGSALCFFHGHHPLSRLHEGSLVTNGTKYVARTEVLYKLPPQLQG